MQQLRAVTENVIFVQYDEFLSRRRLHSITSILEINHSVTLLDDGRLSARSVLSDFARSASHYDAADRSLFGRIRQDDTADAHFTLLFDANQDSIANWSKLWNVISGCCRAGHDTDDIVFADEDVLGTLQGKFCGTKTKFAVQDGVSYGQLKGVLLGADLAIAKSDDVARRWARLSGCGEKNAAGCLFFHVGDFGEDQVAFGGDLYVDSVLLMSYI